MTRSTLVRCDGCGRTMLGGPVIGVGAMAVRRRGAEGEDPDWHYAPGEPDGIGRDVCPACWTDGIR